MALATMADLTRNLDALALVEDGEEAERVLADMARNGLADQARTLRQQLIALGLKALTGGVQ